MLSPSVYRYSKFIMEYCVRLNSEPFVVITLLAHWLYSVMCGFTSACVKEAHVPYSCGHLNARPVVIPWET